MLDFRTATFLTVCETMNYTKAAEILHITQPAVSQHIHYLESYYDTRLFLTQKKKLILTPQGKILYQALSTISHDADILKFQFAQMEKKPAMLKIGVTQTIGCFVLVKPFFQYVRQNKDLAFTYKIEDTRVLLAQLMKGDIDLAIVEGYYQKQEFDSVLLRKESFFPVCSADYLSASRPVTIEELLKEPLIIREKGSGTRNVLEHYLTENHLAVEDFSKIIEINNLQVIKEALLENCGISFLFQSVVQNELAAGSLVTLPLEGFPILHDFTFLWTKNSIHKDWYLELCSAMHSLMPEETITLSN